MSTRAIIEVRAPEVVHRICCHGDGEVDQVRFRDIDWGA